VTLYKNYDASDGPLSPQNMSGYRVSRKYKTVGDPIDKSVYHFLVGAAAGLLSHQCLSMWPSIIEFHTPSAKESALPTFRLTNCDFYETEYTNTRSPWMMYSMGSGRFISTINEKTLPFDMFLCC
jgi:hypothetical protein